MFTQHKFKLPFSGAINRSIDDILTDLTINPRMFGALADGSDDTTAIQNTINACPAGCRVDGLGLSYTVTRLNLKSNMRFESFSLTTKAGSVDGVSAVCIGDNNDTNLRQNIFIRNVYVNGNRQNQTNIGTSEDGARHGFRIVGNVDNILIENCSATYCATDGIEFYSGISTRASGQANNTPQQTNITVKDSRFNWNRRMGGSGNSMDTAKFINCQFNHNGQDLNTTDVATSGNRGANNGTAGQTYGSGFDMEGYDIGSAVNNITFRDCQALQNVRDGIIFFDQTDQQTSGYSVHDNIKILSCNVDAGTNSSDGGTAISITPQSSYNSHGAAYSNVVIADCLVKGNILLRAVNGFSITGGSITGGSYLGTLDYATNGVVGSLNKNGKGFYNNNSSYVQAIQAADPSGIVQKQSITLQPGAAFDLGVARTSTFAMLRIFSHGDLITGGQFAVDVFLGGGGPTIASIYNGGQVGTANTNKLQIDTASTNWRLINNDTVAYTISLYYYP